MSKTIKIVANENIEASGHSWFKGDNYAYYINPSGRMTITSNEGELGYSPTQVKAVLSLFTVLEKHSPELILVSSNENKLIEFNRYGLTDIAIEKGADLKEVAASEETVAIYKALAAGAGRIVEDTSLIVENAGIGSNVRWLMDTIKDHANAEAIWQVYLGVNDGTFIHLYAGRIRGRIIKGFVEPDAFGFDGLFAPYSASGYTLHELEKMGLKDAYSARKKAVGNLLAANPLKSILIKDIPSWTGSYQ